MQEISDDFIEIVGDYDEDDFICGFETSVHNKGLGFGESFNGLNLIYCDIDDWMY